MYICKLHNADTNQYQTTKAVITQVEKNPKKCIVACSCHKNAKRHLLFVKVYRFIRLARFKLISVSFKLIRLDDQI